MKLLVISPETYEPREHSVLAGLFAAGLERYHVRKPSWDAPALRNYIQTVPPDWRSRLVLHQHHELAAELGCGGRHFKDSEVEPALRAGSNTHGTSGRPDVFTSRSCHALSTLAAALGRFHSIFFSPVFRSISKPGHVPKSELGDVSAWLLGRTEHQRTTNVIALGGITPGNCAKAIDCGFDGVAVLGALWLAERPLTVFEQLQHALSAHVARTA